MTDTKAFLTVGQAVAANRTGGKPIPPDGTPVTAVPEVITTKLDYQARPDAEGAPTQVHGPLTTTVVHTAFGTYTKCTVDDWDVDPATIRTEPEQKSWRDQDRDDHGRFMGDTLGSDPTVNERANRLAGAGIDAAFPGGVDGAVVPWPSAGGLRDRQPYDSDLARAAVEGTAGDDKLVDPRVLTATQPSVGRAGVEYYANDPTYRATGRTFADQDQAGNRVPVVYSRTNPNTGRTDHLLLSGHHRAMAALLQGAPLRARVVTGGYGRPHAKTYNPSQERDFHGRFGSGGGPAATPQTPEGGHAQDTAHLTALAAALSHGVHEGGFSVHPATGRSPEKGFMVAVEGRTMQPIMDADDFSRLPAERQVDMVDRWVQANMDLFSNGHTYVGGWVDPATNRLHLDPSENLSDRDEAVRAGQARNQISIWDVEGGREVPTGGTGDQPASMRGTDGRGP